MYTQGKWDLRELSPGHKTPKFAKQISDLQNKVTQFEKLKKSLRPTMPEKDFFRIIKSIEQISEEASVVGGYASLMYSADTQSDEATSLVTRMSKLGAEIDNKMLFFDLWWKRKIDEKTRRG